MSRGGTRVRATKKPVIVIAGENSNDRSSLRHLLEAFCPQMRGRIVEISDPVRLHSATTTLAARAEALGRKARARAARENADLACTFVHEDLDEPDSESYPEIHARVQAALTKACGSAHYVLSVAEMEAWLLLFPDALTKLVSGWTVPKQYRNRDTGTFDDPKKLLKQNVSTAARRYRESDAPDVLAKAVEQNLLDQPVGSNRSWAQLRADASECGQRHIPTMRSAQ